MTRIARPGLLAVALACGVVTAARAQTPPPPPPPPPMGAPLAATGSGAISGLVVDAVTGQPIAEAVVTVGVGPAIRRQLTDARGRFVLRDLPITTSYTVSASRAGYFDARYGAKAARLGKAISLADGQWVKDVRIEMVRPGAITGTVTDEHGEPVVGAFVRVLARMLVSGRQHLVSGPAVRTDDRGAYRIAGLPEGTFFVVVPSVQNAVPADTPAYTVAGLTAQIAATQQAAGRAIPDYAGLDVEGGGRLVIGNYVTPPAATAGTRPQAYAMTFYPNVPAIADAIPIVLGAGDRRDNVSIQLQPVPAWRIAGRVDGPANATAGLFLRLVVPGLEDLGFGSEAATALVGPNGEFAFLDVPAGHYTITAQGSVMEFRYQATGAANLPAFPAPGFGNGSGGGGTLFSGPDGTSYNYANSTAAAAMWAREPIDVGGRDQTNVVVTLRPTASITGVIVSDDPAPPADSTTGGAAPGAASPRPAAPVILLAEPAAGDAWLGNPSGQVTGTPPTRTFELHGLLPGKYILRALGSGAIKSIVWNGKDYTYTAFDATPGQDFTNVVITTTAAAAKPATLSGTVGDFQKFSHGASVIVFPAERDQWSDYGFQPSRVLSISVDNNGGYKANVPPGVYYAIAVDADKGDRWKDPKFLEAVAPLATQVTVTSGQTTSQALAVVEVK